MATATRIDVWADVVCPWCYVGKRRLERALEGIDGVEVAWRSFQLSPDAPRLGEDGAGEPVAAVLARRYGGPDRVRQMHAHLHALASEDGLRLRSERARHVNSFDAHRLIHAAAAHGRSDAMVERLFAAHHVEGERIDEPATLARLAAETGVPAPGDGQYADAVRNDRREAAAIGVAGVPFFLLDGRYALTGAQPAELIREGVLRVRALAA